MKRLLAALAALLLAAMPVRAAPAVDPYLTLDTPPPYHYGGTITVTAHGDIPGRPDEQNAKSSIILACTQPIADPNVYTEDIFSPAPETPYVFHLGQWGSSRWDENGGGAADCTVRLGAVVHYPKVGTTYTSIAFHVEA